MKTLGSSYHSLSSYNCLRRDANRYRQLSKEGTRQLLIRSTKGDTNACNDLANHNLFFVIGTAVHLYGYNNPFISDLIISGWNGLRTAASKFDMSYDVTFLTFAGKYVKGYMNDTIKEMRGHCSISLDAPIDDEESMTLNDYVSSGEDWYADRGIENHVMTSFKKEIRNILGETYANMFFLYSTTDNKRYAYQHIANKFNITVKQTKEIIEYSRSKLQKAYWQFSKCAA